MAVMNTLDYLKVKEVAEICRTTRKTILTWIKEGKLEAIKLPGGNYLISRLDLPTYIRKETNV